MLRFTDPKLYLKGTGRAILTGMDGTIKAYSDKFSTAQIQTSVTLGEIRAGLGNPIATMLPSDAGITVNMEAENFDLGVKAAQVGAALTNNAPSFVCRDVTAQTTSISATGAVAGPGFSEVYAYVQTVGSTSSIYTDGVAYPVAAGGTITGFTATPGTTYKVWFWTYVASAQMATITTTMDPEVNHFMAEFAVFSNVGSGNSGTRAGTLTVVVPRLKGSANANIDGSQTTNDKTSWSGQGLPYDDAVIEEGCNACANAGSPLSFYIYTPCDGSNAPLGVVVIGGKVTADLGTTQVNAYFVYEDGTTALANYNNSVSFALAGTVTGVTISNTGVITVTGDATVGDYEAAVIYNGSPAETFTITVTN